MEKSIDSQQTYSMKPRNVFGVGICAWMTLLGPFLGLVLTPAIHAQELLPSSSPASGGSAASPATFVSDMMRESCQNLAKGDLDAALDKVNGVINLESQNKQALLLRGAIYAKQERWDKADYDYRVALLMDPASSIVKFDMAELNFIQKKYDDARSGFKEVKGDKELGDFATYKVLLCDLFGAHEAVASEDLEALNQAGGNPSYYFGNAAWDLVHNKTDDAAAWLKSAAKIYADSPQKFTKYTTCLTNLGYLPLHLSSAQ